MTTKKPVVHAIFLGRELPIDAPASYYGKWGLMAADDEGNRLDTDTLPPDFDPGSLKLIGVALNIGQPNYLPYWADEAVLRETVAAENFAHPRMQEQIDQWLKEVATGDELYEKVKEAKGLLTLKDVGLEEIPAPAPVEEPKAG